MNLVDAVVTKVLAPPYFEHEMYWLKVEYESWGVLSQTELMFSTKEDAEKVKTGFKFLT